jgi:hypothetical protein
MLSRYESKYALSLANMDSFFATLVSSPWQTYNPLTADLRKVFLIEGQTIAQSH